MIENVVIKSIASELLSGPETCVLYKSQEMAGTREKRLIFHSMIQSMTLNKSEKWPSYTSSFIAIIIAMIKKESQKIDSENTLINVFSGK